MIDDSMIEYPSTHFMSLYKTVMPIAEDPLKTPLKLSLFLEIPSDADIGVVSCCVMTDSESILFMLQFGTVQMKLVVNDTHKGISLFITTNNQFRRNLNDIKN